MKRTEGGARVAPDNGSERAVAALALSVLHAESTDDGELGAAAANNELAVADEDSLTSLPAEMWAKIFGFVAPKTQVLVVPQVGACPPWCGPRVAAFDLCSLPFNCRHHSHCL